jgi:hypothetical protein
VAFKADVLSNNQNKQTDKKERYKQKTYTLKKRKKTQDDGEIGDDRLTKERVLIKMN